MTSHHRFDSRFECHVRKPLDKDLSREFIGGHVYKCTCTGVTQDWTVLRWRLVRNIADRGNCINAYVCCVGLPARHSSSIYVMRILAWSFDAALAYRQLVLRYALHRRLPCEVVYLFVHVAFFENILT